MFYEFFLHEIWLPTSQSIEHVFFLNKPPINFLHTDARRAWIVHAMFVHIRCYGARFIYKQETRVDDRMNQTTLKDYS